MCLPADSNVIMSGDKSFAYDLHVQRSIVSSRVALLLRSAEIKPQLSDLFVFNHTISSWYLSTEVGMYLEEFTFLSS